MYASRSLQNSFLQFLFSDYNLTPVLRAGSPGQEPRASVLRKMHGRVMRHIIFPFGGKCWELSPGGGRNSIVKFLSPRHCVTGQLHVPEIQAGEIICLALSYSPLVDPLSNLLYFGRVVSWVGWYQFLFVRRWNHFTKLCKNPHTA